MNRPYSLFLIFPLLFCSFCLKAQTVLTAENPVGKQYLLRHFGLKGKVKSLTDAYTDWKKTLYFDERGRLSMEKTEDNTRPYFNETLLYSYDSSNRFFKVSNDGVSASTNYYMLNRDGNVINSFQYSLTNKTVTYHYKNNLLDTISYYEKGPAQEKIILKQYIYNYNESGQVIAEVYLDAVKKDTLTTKYYKYTVSDAGTLVWIDNATWMNVYRNKKTWIVKKHYNRNNNLVKEEEVSPSIVITYEYLPDAEGNWIDRNKHKRQIIYYK